MKSYWNSLRPFEKRVVVGAGVLFFLVLNFLFVIPHFSDLGTVQNRRTDAERKLAKFQAEIAQTNLYVRGLAELEKEGGMDVPPEEQSFQFANAIQAQAISSKVELLNNGKINSQTNQFFLEKSQSISVQAPDEQLVDFLYSLGSGGSLIRVRDLSMRPDGPQQKLVANVKLVASYQKKAPLRPSAPGARPAGAQATSASEKSAAPADPGREFTAKPVPTNLKRP
jgi:hypothetical protein